MWRHVGLERIDTEPVPQSLGHCASADKAGGPIDFIVAGDRQPDADVGGKFSAMPNQSGFSPDQSGPGGTVGACKVFRAVTTLAIDIAARTSCEENVTLRRGLRS
jgi:hypothetical protein